MKIRTLLIALAALSACNSSKKTTKKYTELEPLAVKAKALPPAKYQATAERVWDILHTEIRISFDWLSRTATGETVLHIRPYPKAQDSICLDVKGMDVKNVEILPEYERRDIPPFPRGLTDEQMRQYKPPYQRPRNYARVQSYRVAGDSLIIRLTGPVETLTPLQLQIDYKAKPYAQSAKGSAAIREARGLYFINTDYAQPKLPAQIWTQGETESNSHWFPTIDKPNERFTTDIHITVPDSFRTLSNGVLVSSKKDGVTRTDHWKTDKPIQPYAVMMAIGKFSIVEDEKWRGIPVNYYVEPEYAPTAKGMFKHTPEMMEFFSRVTGVPYPWPKYSQVVVRDFVSGAMENTSASTFGEFMNRNSRELLDGDGEDVVSHELFHQWFGDYVTAESWANLTVNESFATYGEVLWRRYKYGDESADELRFNDLQRYLASTERADPPLVRPYYRDKEEMFDRVSYQKGGAILHYMHRLVGDSAFSRAMKIYLTKHALQPAEAHDWRQAVEEATGQDWNPFFNQWYFRGGHPVLEVSYKYDDAQKALEVFVEQKQRDSAFNLPLKAAVIRGSNAYEIVDWQLSHRRDTFRYAYGPNDQPPVFLPDAENVLVGELKDNRPVKSLVPNPWSRIYSYRLGGDYITRRKALQAVAKNLASADGREVLSMGLTDAYPGLRSTALGIVGKTTDTTVRAFATPLILRIAQADTSTQARAAAISLLAAWNNSQLLPIVVNAVNDSSYLVAGTSLLALNRMEESGRKGNLAYSEARRLLPTAERGELWNAALTVIAQYGKAEDTAVFLRELDRVEPGQYRSVLSAYATHASRTNSRAAFSSYLKGADALLRAKTSDKDDRRAYALTLFQLGGALRTPGEATKALGEAEISVRTEATRSLISSTIDREADKDLQNFLRNAYRTNFPTAAKN